MPPGSITLGGDEVAVTYAPGVFDLPGTSAGLFNGTTSHVRLSDADGLLPSLRRRLTVAAWVRPTSLPGSDRFILHVARTGTIPKLALYAASGFNAFGARSDVEALQGVTGTALTAGRWQLMAGDVDFAANKVRLYLDGEPDGEAAVTFTDKVMTSEVAAGDAARIGSAVGGTGFWDGRIAAVYCWERVLDLHEHRALWKLGQQGVML